MIDLSFSALSARLDLGECADRDELVAKLRATRAFTLEALHRPFPVVLPDSYREPRLERRRAEVALCEEALRGLGEQVEIGEASAPHSPVVKA